MNRTSALNEVASRNISCSSINPPPDASAKVTTESIFCADWNMLLQQSVGALVETVTGLLKTVASLYMAVMFARAGEFVLTRLAFHEDAPSNMDVVFSQAAGRS